MKEEHQSSGSIILSASPSIALKAFPSYYISKPSGFFCIIHIFTG